MWFAIAFFYPVVGFTQAELTLAWGDRSREIIAAALTTRGAVIVTRHVANVDEAERFQTQVRQGLVR